MALAAYDAAGEQILGAGAPRLSIASNDTVHLAATAGVSNGSYSLVPPSTLLSATIPNAHAVVALTVAATPPVGSGIAPVTRKIDVTFDATVCGVVDAIRGERLSERHHRRTRRRDVVYRAVPESGGAVDGSDAESVEHRNAAARTARLSDRRRIGRVARSAVHHRR